MKYRLEITHYNNPLSRGVVSSYPNLSLSEASAVVSDAGLPPLILEPNSPEPGDVSGYSELYSQLVWDEQGYPITLADARLLPAE